MNDRAVKARHSAVLLDRHPLWLAAVGELFARAGIDVQGTATSEEDALGLLSEHDPDVLIFDPDACDSEPGSFLDAVTKENPGIKALAVSETGHHDKIEATLQAGAAAYVIKTIHPDDLAVAVRQIFSQTIHWAPSAGMHRRPLVPTGLQEDTLSVLTLREREILGIVAEGKSNGEIARMLWVTEQTVKFHLSNIYRKLEVANRTEASRWVHAQGVTPTGGPQIRSLASLHPSAA
jgi:DNA-binding NarL/FixJ family response regulator